MCGIVGFATAGGGRLIPGREALQRMCDSIIHRGPDAEGMLLDARVGIGARRLAVIDLTGGQQPMTNAGGTVTTVFNGEIYNFRELRSELSGAGHVFRSLSDTEIILHAYEQWGDEFAARLNGMFAIAVYDVPAGRILLARDPVGIKPLYYALTEDCLVWGSEIKAVLASGVVQRELDLDVLGQFVAWEYCPGETTLFKAVRKLLPGHLLTLDIESGRRRVHRYWEVPAAETDAHEDAYWVDRVDEALRTAVRRQLVSDVPLGAFLSGGVDSSLVVAAMGGATTFSIGFDDPSYNELTHSTAVARHLGVPHVTEIVQPDVLDLFDRMVDFMDDPIGDSSIFPTYLVSKLARERVTVSLSGDGGDELFGGYESYLAAGVAGYYDRLPRMLRRGLVQPAIGMLRPTSAKKGAINKALRFVEGARHDPQLGHARWRLFMDERFKSQLFTADAAAAMTTPAAAHIERLFREARDREPLSRCLYVDLFSYLPDDILTKLDRMSMAVSLESRVPFLDKEMIGLAFSVPDRLKIRGGTSKWILKQVAERYLPAPAVHRPKEGFSAPLKRWIAGSHRSLMDELLSERRIRQEGILEWPAIRRLREEHLAGRRNHSHLLWGLMLFQAWQDRWLRA